jgi:hypothetical protein
MKVYRSPDGVDRIWFAADEIEQIMEDELRKAGLYPTAEVPAVSLEDLVELHLKAHLDQHADLGADVLGMTEFERGRSPKISINRDLSGAAADLGDALSGKMGRWRATLAHEAAHVLLHRILYEFDDRQTELFSSEIKVAAKPLMRCLKRGVAFRGGGSDWREVQANKGMAALLMPKAIFHEVTRRLISEGGIGQLAQLDDEEASKVVRVLANHFQVSKQAARIRLSTLGYLGSEASLELDKR